MKKKSKTRTQASAVSVKVDLAQYEALRRLAAERDRTIGGELRRAIRQYLEAQAA